MQGVAAREILRQVWVQNFLVENGTEGSPIEWRAIDQVPPSGRYIRSPHESRAALREPDATVWSGDKVNLTKRATTAPRT